MMHTLEDALDRALNEGYDGLWATGDIDVGIGPRKRFFETSGI
jgi:hypothetical protein